MQHENLWAPWRLAYLRRLDARREAAGEVAPEGLVNFLAHNWSTPQDDVANHVILRSECGLILLNRYPYSNGHLLVALGEAKPTLIDYRPEARAAFWGLVERAMSLVTEVLQPQGINMGINQGMAAGAGLPEHVHAHIVPRWGGDTNFMTVTGDVRVCPASLEDMAAIYREAISGRKSSAQS